MTIRSAIAALDVFGYSPNLNFAKKSKFKSVFGGLITILYFGLLVLMTNIIINISTNKYNQIVTRETIYHSHDFDNILLDTSSDKKLKLKFIFMFQIITNNKNKTNSSLPPDDYSFKVDTLSTNIKQPQKESLKINKCNFTEYTDYYCVEDYLTNTSSIEFSITSNKSNGSNFNNLTNSINENILHLIYPIRTVNPCRLNDETNSKNLNHSQFSFKEEFINLDDKIRKVNRFAPVFYISDPLLDFLFPYKTYFLDYNYILVDNLEYFNSKTEIFGLSIGMSDKYFLYKLSNDKILLKILTIIIFVFITYKITDFIIQFLNRRNFNHDMMNIIKKKVEQINLSNTNIENRNLREFGFYKSNSEMSQIFNNASIDRIYRSNSNSNKSKAADIPLYTFSSPLELNNENLQKINTPINNQDSNSQQIENENCSNKVNLNLGNNLDHSSSFNLNKNVNGISSSFELKSSFYSNAPSSRDSNGVFIHKKVLNADERSTNNKESTQNKNKEILRKSCCCNTLKRMVNLLFRTGNAANIKLREMSNNINEIVLEFTSIETLCANNYMIDKYFKLTN